MWRSLRKNYGCHGCVAARRQSSEGGAIWRTVSARSIHLPGRARGYDGIPTALPSSLDAMLCHHPLPPGGTAASDDSPYLYFTKAS